MLARCSSDFVPLSPLQLQQLLLTVVLWLCTLETGQCGTVSCPAGSYCPDSVSAPIACPPGAYCTAGVSIYTNCTAGTWSTATNATSSRTCTTCTRGNYCTGGSAITPCEAGSYGETTGLTSSASCTTCYLGEYCTGGAARYGCPATTYGASTGLTASGSCSPCPAGSYCRYGYMTTCPAGSWCAANVSSPTACVAGTWSTATGATSNSTCATCTIGSYCTGGTTNTSCQAGTYGASTGLTAASSCTTCPLGNTCAGGADNTPCAAGTYGPFTGSDDPSSSCFQCSPGSYCSGGAVQTVCIAGTWSTATGATSSTTCAACVAGSYCPGGFATITCRGGTWSAASSAGSSDACADCPAGSYCPDGSVKPIPCRPEADEYCPQPGMSKPRSCNPGYFYQLSYYCKDAITQVPCPAGSFCTFYSSPEPCAADQMSNEGAWFCDPCPNNWYTSNSGSSSCSKPTPMMIGLVCMFCVLFVCCWICGIGICVFSGRESEKQEREKRQKKIESELAAQKAKEERERKSEEIDRNWREAMKPACDIIRQDILERLMRDLRMDLELRYPQGLEMVPTVAATRMMLDVNSLNSTEEGVPNNSSDDAEILHIRFVDESASPMQAYQQFIADQISSDFESYVMRYAIQALATKWKKPIPFINVIDFHKAILGIRSMVLESYPLFMQARQPHQEGYVDPSVEEAPGGVDRQQVALQTIKVRLSEELRLHASTWVESRKIHIVYNSPDKGEDFV